MWGLRRAELDGGAAESRQYRSLWPRLGAGDSVSATQSRPCGLLAQAVGLEGLAVALDVLPLQVVEEAPAPADELE